MTRSSVIEFSPKETRVHELPGELHEYFAIETPSMHVPCIQVWPKAELSFQFYMETSIPPELQDALDDLSRVAEEALEEGLDEPSPEALENAERVLLTMYGLKCYRYEVYPATARAVIVDCPYNRGSVMAMCESNGEILLFLNANGKQTSKRVASIGDDGDKVRMVLDAYMSKLGVPS